ncbi:hypothetical protein O0I10_003286 [Lichtheimia ornata]|uniref:Uncharacterized protein n=1 Tax=Lichtheimia ornata TaxID=688661 RepID=A0AAD7V9G0_9FUNG|nr:uncharacterized protein O0I10_003286 [Lichtheimia ornata]KAJ8661063.1 hypothetical protein O0I10_003286 [Lichtheimia ornata]
MSYFARVELDEWKLEDAIQHYREKKPDGGKLLLQLVLDDLNNLVNAERKGEKEAARKIVSAIEKAQAYQITGGNTQSATSGYSYTTLMARIYA